jgi:hypothetical protein
MNHSTRVFVVQNVHEFNERTGQLEPKFDFLHTLEYLPGCTTVQQALAANRLRFLLHPSDAPWKPDIVERLRLGLEDYSPNDYLLLIGNPILMGVATNCAFEVSAKVNFLQWSKSSQLRQGRSGYIAVSITAD